MCRAKALNANPVRYNQLWQVVLSPGGQAGGYRRPLV
jgi:hypothetical protein